MASENETKNAITIFGKLDAPQTGQSAEPLTIDLTAIETRIGPPQTEAMDAGAADAQPQADRRDKFSALAASLVAAVLAGAFATGVASYELARQAMPSDPVAAAGDETQELKDRLARLTGEFEALKASAEAANRNSSQQFAQFVERIDRAEKALAEPVSKLAKLGDGLDRLERRVASAPAVDVTGSVTSIEKQQGKPPEVEGWTLREYFAGRALLESRNGRLFEVGPGSNLPGVGKVEAIKRVDGKIVVTTPKGVIASALEPPRRPYTLPHRY